MIIDVHSHIASRELILRPGAGYRLERQPSGRLMIRTPSYAVPVGEEMFDPSLQIQRMEEQGIDKKVICVPPFLMGSEFDGPFAREWARDSNRFIADCCARYPERFVGFGILPLTSEEGALEELAYGVEVLGLKGFEFATHHRGRNLDGEEFAPIFRDLDRRGLPVLIHPAMVRARRDLELGFLSNLVGNPVETTIAASRMLAGGFLARHRRLRVLLSHGGGALPYLLGRMEHEQRSRGQGDLVLPENLYFDTVVFDCETLRFLCARCKNVALGSDAPFDMSEQDPVGFVRGGALPHRVRDILTDCPGRFLGMAKQKG